MASSLASSLLPTPLTFRNSTSTSTDSLQLAFRLDRLSLSTSAHSPHHFKRSNGNSLLFSRRDSLKVRAEVNEAETVKGGENLDAFSSVKHVLFPVTDRNPYLSEGTRQAAATTTSLAKKYGADITVVVVDERPKDDIPEHDTQISSIRWHLSEGGFKEFGLMERLGEGKVPTAIIGEVADELNLDLVVLSMESIHSKHVDANLLAEFMPCPVLLLPL